MVETTIAAMMGAGVDPCCGAAARRAGGSWSWLMVLQMDWIVSVVVCSSAFEHCGAAAQSLMPAVIAEDLLPQMQDQSSGPEQYW